MDFINFIPNFGSPILTIGAFVLALSIIVAIHEYGHYIVGRWSGIDAEVFSIGFGPVLWSRMDRRGTRWQVAAFPLGGFVKFLGDGNAASVGGDGETEKARNTMLGAPLWARAATVAAGPIFNFILSMLVFAALLVTLGQPLKPLTVSELPDWPENRALELQAGDTILRVEGVALDFPEGFRDALGQLPSVAELDYEIERDGTRMTVPGPHPTPSLVQSITPRSAADDAGLRIGDLVLSMNGTPVYSFADMVEVVNATGPQPISLEIWRDGAMRQEVITPRMAAIPQPNGSMIEEPKLGIGNGGLFFEPKTMSVGLWEALTLGAQQVWFIIVQSLNGLWHIITGAISTCNLSGPVGIAETAGSMASQGLESFITFIAVMSTAIGLLNLFPIPILDGGHLVFHAWEAVTGKPPSDGALRILMAIGLSLIGTLMIFAIANDLFLCP
ncbi:RIP metalloprotease RseP [Salibaculum griseiflavum]|uniref:Zinc metalloprotease n=1 Tax=Salibaculum griseiflavum TaxID=1914409 RepID=A0A2V1P8C9_9RHOB|nr:RIP metalloprotease RseP [Salibaculum griseiflavum]PWG18094.1 RIP metalloprotease RseP [Salibaculum griseiflavum]